jgi:chromosome partitioning protein
VARLIAVVNQKGGVGKTTTAVNLSAALARLGKRGLLLDLDPQSNATSGLGLTPAEVAHSAYTVLVGDSRADQAIRPTQMPGLDILPSNRELTGAEIELVGVEGREFKLRDAIASERDKRDFIIVDCPPSLGLLTINALSAADALLVPLQCEYYALEGLSSLLDTVERVRSGLNPALAIEGILLTMFDTRNAICHQVAEEARRHFPDKVFRTVIPRNVRLSESPSHGLPIILYDPGSRGAQSYMELGVEVAKTLGGS